MNDDENDELGRLIHSARTKVNISDERLDRIIGAVLRELSAPPAQATGRFGRWRRWPIVAPVAQFALPMLVAALLGISVAGDYAAEWPVAQFSRLLLSNSLIAEGS